jgi:hypothetical protein
MANVRGIGWSLALVIGMVGGCSGGGSGSSGNIPLESLGTNVVDAICPLVTRCGEYPDEATCKASMTTDLGQVQADVAAGKIKYDGQQAAGCVAALPSFLDCSASATTDQPAACEKTFTGTVAAGGPCFDPRECVSGQCSYGSNCGATDTCCAGMCVDAASLPLGQPCTEPGACAKGAFCDVGSGTPTCVAAKGPGEACTNFDECAAGTSCLQSSANGTASQACITPSKEGETCSGPGTCALTTDFCDPDALKCKARLVPGSPCQANATEDACVAWAFCNSATSRCVARARLTEACDNFGGTPCMGSLDCLGGICEHHQAQICQ